MTRQRRVILEAVKGMDSHPTADEVYRQVQRRLPHISLGTVYRNLELLSERGLIQKIGTGGEQRRFDRTLEEHYHVRCVDCGRAQDVSVKPDLPTTRAVQRVSSYRILGHRLEWVGLCPSCARDGSKPHEGSPGKGREER
jgi:Fur family ferric uptake transcriptional regulator